MAAVKALMRVYSYVFHAFLALFLIAISTLALLSGHSLKLQMLPWTGAALNYWLLFGALAGLITVILAVQGVLRSLFLAWSGLVLVLLLRGYFFSGFHFSGATEFKTALWLTAGAIVALIGAWFQFRREPARR